MKRPAMARALATVVLAAIVGTAPVAAGAGEVRLNGRTFTLPEGFTVELAAGPPLVERPIVADCDEQGRLYVADSSGSNENVQKQLAEKPHRVVRLEDSDGDGRYDRRTVFADRMMFPEGAMWAGGSFYVAAPPSIWKLTDTDGDGVADRREEWFRGKTLTGCANDLHGPYPGPDGWIYWCKGAFAEQTYDRPGRPPLVTRAAHIFRARPDGSGIEPVLTGGMDNPVDVVFTPGGERILTCTFLQQPGGGRRDGLIHAVYGGVYGKVHDVIEGHPRTGPDVMPPITHLGPAAPCGLVRYESDAFGADYRDNLFAALFNLHKVTRHVLIPAGSTFTTRDEDFLVASDLDFHPTDVQEDADGSLLVLDTGGWYKLCCPTSQLGKPDVLGAIYRVRRVGAPRNPDPRGLAIDWASAPAQRLGVLLSDARPAVRRRAVETLARKGDEAVPTLRDILFGDQHSSAEARRNAVWTATRIDGADMRRLVRAALHDPDDTVRLAAIHSASVHRDRASVHGFRNQLLSGSAAVRRAAAEGLGRVGNGDAVPALLEAAGMGSDRVLEHSVTYALIEIGDARATSAGLGSPNVRTRRAALIALDQMERGTLGPDEVIPLLGATDPDLKETASWIVGHHPGWGGALAGFLRDRLHSKDLTAADASEIEGQLSRAARTSPVQTVLADCLREPSISRASRLIGLRAMAQSGLKEAPEGWIVALADLLTGDDAGLTRQAVATARALPISKARAGRLGPRLLAIADAATTPEALRLEALAAVPGGLDEVRPDVFAFLRDRLSPDRPVAVRGTAAQILSRARLGHDQLVALAGMVATAGPLDVDRLLSAFGRSDDNRVGRALVAALKQSPARPSLRVDTLKPRLAKFGPEVRREAETLYAALDEDSAKQTARLEGLLATLSAGDVRRGQVVFNGAKAACASCHAIGYLGGQVGPDLTRIGQIRSERDLLEAIVFPSASFVRSFEPVVVATKDGKVVGGLLRKDAPEEVVLATGPTEVVRIARDDIEEMRPGTVSVMPAGLDQQLTPAELADLVAFLKACR